MIFDEIMFFTLKIHKFYQYFLTIKNVKLKNKQYNNSKMIFISECEDLYYQQISGDTSEIMTDLSNFKPKTVTLNGNEIIDEDERVCLVNNNKFKIDFTSTEELPNDIDLSDNEWELLAYQSDGFFNKHKDMKRFPEHRYTAILYLSSVYTGGDMIIHGKYHQTNLILENIDKPLLLIFDINMPHESLPVTSGIKILFKTSVGINPKLRKYLTDALDMSEENEEYREDELCD